MSHALSVPVHALLTGKAVPYSRPNTRSGIHKQPLEGALHIGELGLEGDEQGDLRVHGGPDKAVHHYAFDHYPQWRSELGELAVLQQPGAFGENISTHGLTEASVCFADRFQLGSAILEVSQHRQPCWKLNDRFNIPDMAKRLQDSGRTGWYYRVLQPGVASPGDMLTLIARPHPEWTLLRIIRLLFDRVLDPKQLAPLLELPLTPSHRKLVEQRLQSHAVEDWGKRIDGPTTG